VRLTLRGVGECDGWPEDLELLLLMQWLCEVERQQDAEETDPTAMAVDFAAAVGLLVEPEHLPGESAAALDDQAANLTGPDQGQVGDQELPSELPQADENKEEEVSPEVEQNRARLVRLYVLADLLLPMSWPISSCRTSGLESAISDGPTVALAIHARPETAPTLPRCQNGRRATRSN